jgi:hypothetical protein
VKLRNLQARPEMVGINGRPYNEVRLEVKGNGSLASIEGKLARFLCPRCTTRQGGALGMQSKAPRGL